MRKNKFGKRKLLAILLLMAIIFTHIMQAALAAEGNGDGTEGTSGTALDGILGAVSEEMSGVVPDKISGKESDEISGVGSDEAAGRISSETSGAESGEISGALPDGTSEAVLGGISGTESGEISGALPDGTSEAVLGGISGADSDERPDSIHGGTEIGITSGSVAERDDADCDVMQHNAVSGSDADKAQDSHKNGTESETEEMADEMPFLTAINGVTEVVVTNLDGSYFAPDTEVRLLSLADVAEDAEDVQAEYDVWEKKLKKAWIDALAEDYINSHSGSWTQKERDSIANKIEESICAFMPFYVQVIDDSGNEISGNGVELDFHVHDKVMYEKEINNEVHCYVGRHDEKCNYIVEPETGKCKITRQDDGRYLVYTIAAAELGWFSLLQTELPWKVEIETQEQTERALEAGSETEIETGSGIEIETESETEIETGSETEIEIGSETEIEAGSEPELETELEDGFEDELPVCNCEEENMDNNFWHGLDCPVFRRGLIEACSCKTKEGSIFAHEYECEGVLKAMEALCSDACGEGERPWIWHDTKCPSYVRILQALCTCSSTGTDVTEHQEECAALEYAYEMRDFYFGDVSMYYATSPDGTPIRNMASYTKVTMGSMAYSNKYTPLRTYMNSVITPWCTDTANILIGHSTATNREYFLPVSANGKGKCGWRVTNVGYDRTNKCYLDLKVTLNNYNTSCKTGSGANVTGVYPHVGLTNSLGLSWDGALPSFELKYEVVKSGTDTLVTGNYRFQWLDIDDLQRFGISVEGGSIDAKYCLTNATPYGETHSYFGRSYECLNAVNEASASDDPRYSVWFDIGNTSTFYMFVGQTGNRSASRYSQDTIKKRYASSADGSRGAIGGLNWKSSAPGPVEPLPDPVSKTVSTDGVTWDTSNVLPTSESEFWYRIEAYVPYEAADFYYNYFEVNDILPAGVDYAGEFSAVKVESGQNATGYFTVVNNNDHLTFTAMAERMALTSFYGYNYRFQFKVRMNPTEMAPAYSGNTAVYTVQNMASVYARHKTENAVTSKNTNAVTTTAYEERAVLAGPCKRLDGNEGLTCRKLDKKEDAFVFSIYQDVPLNSASWYPSRITMTDVLADCLQVDSYAAYLRPYGSDSYMPWDGWSFSVDGQAVTVSGAYVPAYTGGRLRFDLSCRVKEGVDLDGYYQKIDGTTWAAIPNTANVRFDWAHGSPASVSQDTDQVTVLVPINCTSLELVKTNEDTGEVISNAVFNVYEWDGSAYSKDLGTMKFQAEAGTYRMDNITRSTANQGKFKVIETVTPSGHTGVWEQEFEVLEGSGYSTVLRYEPTNPMAKGTITVYKRSKDLGELLSGAEYEIKANKDVVSPQGQVLVPSGTVVGTLKTGTDGKAVSKALYPGEYAITETKAPLGYTLDTVPKVVSVLYKDRDTPLTNTDVTFINGRLYSCINLTKEIKAADIVWAHGNPTFTFKVEGKDVLDVMHTYYETVEFTPDSVGSGSKVTVTAKITVLAGTYTATEEKTARYKLEQIHSVSGGTASEDSVIFHVGKGETGRATFYNSKATDEDLSHTAFVRNTIKK